MSLAFLVIALCCSALGAGGAYTTLFSLSPAGQTKEAWVKQMQHAIPRIGVPLFVVQPIAALSTVASAVLTRGESPAFWFFGSATAFFAAAAIITRLVHIPINVRLTAMGSDPLSDSFASVQRRWWRFHVVRSAALFLGLLALVFGALTRMRA
jgi:hypothetical protein